MNTKIILPSLISFVITLFIAPIGIPFLRKLKFGQFVRDDGPKSHLKKSGTPTMGGIIFFFDAGNAYARNQSFDFNDLYTSAGLETRIFVPALRVPFRLIFAYNNRLTPQNRNHFNFRFAIGTTF